MLHDAHNHLLKRDEMLSAPQDGYEPCAMASCLRLQAARFLDSVLEALAKRKGGHLGREEEEKRKKSDTEPQNKG